MTQLQTDEMEFCAGTFWDHAVRLSAELENSTGLLKHLTSVLPTAAGQKTGRFLFAATAIQTSAQLVGSSW